ncbi:PIG-L family deacetylase [Sphaerisporangium fuscum]|uniref:PIG-L family deacetylase n=1 Tax=Sphaerisporangium fuscum TaxID=2835868 RepID=UPI001BDDB2DF|nr:PIG-L family deacetylase [Sphaerisporangium fuscum]
MAELSLLCVHAHPDDEALWTGGVLARYADAGARTAVVTCTWAAGTRRAAELERSLEILGAGRPRLLGYAEARVPTSAPTPDASSPDSADSTGTPSSPEAAGIAVPPLRRFLDVPLEESVGRVVEHIREFRPDVVITYDGYGGYGHEDHLHTHRVTLAAVEAAGYDQLYQGCGEPWRPRAVYLATLPRTLVRAVWRDVFGVEPEPGQTLPGVPDEQVTTTVDVRPWADRKWAAMMAHESEVQRGGSMTMFAALPPSTRDRLLATEWYIRRDVTSPTRDTGGIFA